MNKLFYKCLLISGSNHHIFEHLNLSPKGVRLHLSYSSLTEKCYLCVLAAWNSYAKCYVNKRIACWNQHLHKRAQHFPLIFVSPQQLYVSTLFFNKRNPRSQLSRTFIHHTGLPQSPCKETSLFTGVPTDLFIPLHTDRYLPYDKPGQSRSFWRHCQKEIRWIVPTHLHVWKHSFF